MTIKGDSNLKAENIKKGTSIFGVTGTLESGGGGTRETWVINESPTLTNDMLLGDFDSAGISFKAILLSDSKMTYDQSEGESTSIAVAYNTSWAVPWQSQFYRKLIFTTPPTGNMLTWLQANAVKQPSDVAIQTDKTLTITSNGTIDIMPDVPYDAMSKMAVTVNVPSSGGIVWVDPD